MYLKPEEKRKLWVSNMPEGKSGNCEIKKFKITAGEANFHNLRCLMRGCADHQIMPGNYTKLLIDGATMMSDTDKEYLDHRALFNMASGNILIMGLGLGCAATVVASTPGVQRVTIIEISEDVIKLVGPTLTERFGDKIEIIQADAFTWKAPVGSYWGAVWFDIWLHISPDNLPEMTKFKRKFARRCNWMGCWSEVEAREFLRMEKRMQRDLVRAASI